jgi:hypothetical protein
MSEEVAGGSYMRVYSTSRKVDLHDYLVSAVEQSGGRVLYASSPARAPVYLGVQTPGDARAGILAYPFRATHRQILNRPSDEHRLQLRYGSEQSWDDLHTIGRDIAGVDTTVVLGAHLERDVLIGLDPALYDPFPMGVSVEFKDEDVRAVPPGAV